MKSTVLSEKHISLGAKMTEFAGYNMPIQYTSLKEEHMAVREGVGVFDVSHMGEFIIKGKEAYDLVQSISSNDAAKLEIGDAQYSALLNDNGGIVDDMLVYRLPEDRCAEGEKAYMLVVNASNIEKDWSWIEKKCTHDVKMSNISDSSGLLAVQGPHAIKLLQSLTEIDLSAISYYTFKKGRIANIDNVLISATGYTGSGGFELYVDNKDLEKLWDRIFVAGEDMNVAACGLGSRDTLRLEMGYCLYGNDINDGTTPLEAGLGWITKLDIEDNFTAKEILKTQREKGVSKRLVGFTLDGRRVPRHGYKIFDLEGEEIGVVTSGTQSPMLNIPIGMGYVKKGYTKAGTIVNIGIGKKMHEAVIHKFPFVEV